MFGSWQAYALGSAFFAALTAILAKVGVKGVNSNYATFIRTIVILFVLILFLSLRNEWQRSGSLSVRTLLFLCLSGVATGLSWLCYFRALQLGPASRVAPVDKLSVVITMLLAAFLLGEKLGAKQIIGGVLIALGSLLMAI
jgi:transporter family protein